MTEPCQNEGPGRKLADIKVFTSSEIKLSEPQHVLCEQFGSFIVYVCLKGGASIHVPSPQGPQAGVERYQLVKGEAVLVPAEIPDFYLVPDEKDTLVIETVIEPREESDSYMN